MILIITEKFDPHSIMLEPLFDAAGIEWHRIHLSDFPTAASISYEVLSGKVYGKIQFNNNEIDFSEIKSIWYRRTEKYIFPAEMNKEDSKLAFAECNAFVNGLWQMLNDKFWVSDPVAIRAASSKAEQLRRAAQLGFDVPDTLFSNVPEKINNFFNKYSGNRRVIYKPHTPIILKDATKKEAQVLYTTLLDEHKMKYIDEIKITPGIFQEHIPKQYDIRVTIFGTKAFACAIYSQKNSDTIVDFRANNWNDKNSFPEHKIINLPNKVSKMCVDLVKSYNLQFGAIDLVLSKDNRYYFLEINPNGQWGWIQEETGLKLNEELFHLLKQNN